jgi:hypothetical protein
LQADEHCDRKRGKRRYFTRQGAVVLDPGFFCLSLALSLMFLLVMMSRFWWLDMNGFTDIAEGSANTSGESRAALYGSQTLKSHGDSDVLSTIATPV